MSRFSPVRYSLPPLFKRLQTNVNPTILHLERLRDNPTYRYRQQLTIVHGIDNIKELINDKIPIRSIIATVEDIPPNEEAIKFPSAEVIKEPSFFPAERYFVTNIDMTRKILGTHAKPQRHEVYAEVHYPKTPFPSPDKIDCVLVLDKIIDPIELASIIRSAQGLHWNAGFCLPGTVDVYHDRAITYSHAATLRWPHMVGGVGDLENFLSEWNMTPVIASPIPSKPFPPADLTEHKGLAWWNRPKDQPQFEIPKRIALILIKHHIGVKREVFPRGWLHVGVPTTSNIRSLDVVSATVSLITAINSALGKVAEVPKPNPDISPEIIAAVEAAAEQERIAREAEWTEASLDEEDSNEDNDKDLKEESEDKEDDDMVDEDEWDDREGDDGDDEEDGGGGYKVSKTKNSSERKIQ